MTSSAHDETACGYLSLNIERSADSARLVLTGELDLGSAPLAGDALMRLELESANPLTVDMESVTFMDCSGLSVLLGAYNRAHRDDRAFVITNVQPAVRRIFNLTGCSHLLTGRASKSVTA